MRLAKRQRAASRDSASFGSTPPPSPASHSAPLRTRHPTVSTSPPRANMPPMPTNAGHPGMRERTTFDKCPPSPPCHPYPYLTLPSSAPRANSCSPGKMGAMLGGCAPSPLPRKKIRTYPLTASQPSGSSWAFCSVGALPRRSCWAGWLTAAAAAVGGFNIMKYGAGPNGPMRTLGQYMLGSGATFGYGWSRLLELSSGWLWPLDGVRLC